MENTSPTRITRHAGSLALTVWPDTPVERRPRFGYRVTDTTTGQSVEGRDLMLGTGQAEDSSEAIRVLAAFLSAAGEASGSWDAFPDWIAEAARTNSDDLALLSESDDPSGPEVAAASPEPERWISVVFLQGPEANDLLDLIDRQGTDAAIEYLAGYDYGEETVQAALENGYVYDDLPTGTVDEVAQRDVYTLTYNHHLGHVHLLRVHDAVPDPVLLGIEDPAAPRPAPERAPVPRPGGSAAGVERDWFASPPASGAGGAPRGLSR
ncbi:hypothetical protein GCM10009788_24060 [Nocardioides humi]|uniref:Uncharacterized protein n=1 Tax=Nocardioides humi TaxID=449461 RepID=A0ABN2AH84_9ACTN